MDVKMLFNAVEVSNCKFLVHARTQITHKCGTCFVLYRYRACDNKMAFKGSKMRMKPRMTVHQAVMLSAARVCSARRNRQTYF